MVLKEAISISDKVKPQLQVKKKEENYDTYR